MWKCFSDKVCTNLGNNNISQIFQKSFAKMNTNFYQDLFFAKFWFVPSSDCHMFYRVILSSLFYNCCKGKCCKFYGQPLHHLFLFYSELQVELALSSSPPIACQTRWKTFFPFLFNKTQTKNNCILNVINIRL